MLLLKEQNLELNINFEWAVPKRIISITTYCILRRRGKYIK